MIFYIPFSQHESLMVKKFALIAIKDVIENSEQKAEVCINEREII